MPRPPAEALLRAEEPVSVAVAGWALEAWLRGVWAASPKVAPAG